MAMHLLFFLAVAVETNGIVIVSSPCSWTHLASYLSLDLLRSDDSKPTISLSPASRRMILYDELFGSVASTHSLSRNSVER